MVLTSSLRVALIAAVSQNGVIGNRGSLPWHLPADLKHFKALTTGKRIVMGRRTWESFPKPLPHREHIVVTSRALHVPEGVRVVRSLNEALAMADPTDPVFIIGGSAMYAEAMAHATDLYLTEIHEVVTGDTVFPEWNRTGFKEASRESHRGDFRLAGEGAEQLRSVAFDVVHYVRR